jgi:toxin ParE1/3/4
MKIRLSDEAKADLASIRKHIAADNPRAAADVLRSIRDTLRDTIAHFPLAGMRCDELAPGLRCFPVGNYVVFYLIGGGIDVVRVLHGARDIEAIFRD